MQFSGVGTELSGAERDQGDVQEGRQATAEGDGRPRCIYNRGILDAALHIEAVRNALTLTDGKPPTGADVKKGFEMIQGFSLGGLVPPLQVTPTDHEGGGWVQIFQVKGDGLVKETEWFQRLSRSGAAHGERRVVTIVRGRRGAIASPASGAEPSAMAAH